MRNQITAKERPTKPLLWKQAENPALSEACNNYRINFQSCLWRAQTCNPSNNTKLYSRTSYKKISNYCSLCEITPASVLPDQHPQRGFYPQLMGRAHLERGSCNPRWCAASLSVGAASVAIYTGQAHTGNCTSWPCMGWTPAEGGGKNSLSQFFVPLQEKEKPIARDRLQSKIQNIRKWNTTKKISFIFNSHKTPSPKLNNQYKL